MSAEKSYFSEKVQELNERDEKDENDCMKRFTSRVVSSLLELDVLDEHLHINAECLTVSYSEPIETS